MLRLPPAVARPNAALIAAVDALVDKHGSARNALLPILRDLRADQGEISDLAMQLIADRLGTSPADVQGVVTFYAFLGTQRRGHHVIRLCRTLSCAMAGTEALAAALEAELGIPFGRTTSDGAITLEWTNCIGQCDGAPAALVDDQPLRRLTPDRVADTIATLRRTDAPT